MLFFSAARVRSPLVQCRILAVHIYRIRALLRALPLRRRCASVHERISGRQRYWNCHTKSFLSAGWMRRMCMARGVGSLLKSRFWMVISICGLASFCRPSRMLALTGVLVLGVGDSLVCDGSHHSERRVNHQISPRRQLLARNLVAIAGPRRRRRQLRGASHSRSLSSSSRGCCACVE